MKDQDSLTAQSTPQAPLPSLSPRAITFRALLIGAFLIPANILWVVRVEYVRYSDNVSTSSLFFNAIFLLLALTILNRVLSRFAPRLALWRGELLVIYVMVVVSTAICGHDQMEILFSTLHYAVQRATPENRWAQTILPNLPSHLVPPAGEALRDLYRGGSTLYTPSHYLVWLKPLSCWTAFVLAAVWVMLCMASIFRRQWDAERLTYPIAEIPLQMTDPKARIFGSKLFWLACGLAAAARIIVVLHLLYPTVPELPINVRYFPLATSLPWSAAGSIPVSFFPFAIGLSFFLPTQISFSVLAFFLLTRLEMVAAAAAGYTTWGGFPYVSEQGVGAAIGLAVSVLLYARAHLGKVWRHALGVAKTDDSNEPLPYSVAFWGFFLGSLFLIAFAIGAGMRPFTAVAFMAVLLLLVLAVARIRAEVGLPTVELFMVGSDSVLRTIAGDSFWTRKDLTVMSLFFWLTRTHRQFAMNSQVDGMRIANRSGVSQRSMSTAMMIGAAIAVISAFWAFLHVMYQVGYESANYSQLILSSFGQTPWDKAQTAIVAPMAADPGRTGGYAFGAVFAFFLGFMRLRFSWWPFHPAGYLAASCFALFRLWVPLFIAWAAKTALLRYGGLKGYQRAIPFFVGLIVGEFVVGMVVSLLGLYGVVQVPPQAGIGGL